MSILQCSSSNFNGSHSTESWSDFVISNGKIQLFWPYWDFISAFLLKPLRIHSRNSSAFQTTLGFSRGGGGVRIPSKDDFYEHLVWYLKTWQHNTNGFEKKCEITSYLLSKFFSTSDTNFTLEECSPWPAMHSSAASEMNTSSSDWNR